MTTPTAQTQARKSAVYLFCLLAAAASIGFATFGCVREDDLTADQRAYTLSTQLMCPVCDGQTLDQSQAQLSEDMKAVIEQKIEDGDSNAEIRDYFVERYGEIVLASPGAGGFNLIAWVVPVVIFAGGALLVFNAYLNMRRRKTRQSNPSSDDQDVEVIRDERATDSDLDEYLQRADREMGTVLSEKSPDADRRTAAEDKE